MIRKANQTDISTIALLAVKTRNHMQSLGLKQWVGDYPNQKHFKNDMDHHGLFVYEKDEQIIASISILPENDAAYQVIQWSTDHALVIHRLIVDPDYQKQGIGKAMFLFAQNMVKNDYKGIKVDTHPNNHRMQALIIHMGFKYKGYIKSINRLAYEWVPNDSKKV